MTGLLLVIMLAGCVATDQRDRSKDRAPQLAIPVGLEHLEWMTGTWRREQGDEISEEIWSTPEGDLMLGMNRTVVAGQTQLFEYLRIQIVEDVGAVYLASPMGRPPTPFPLVRLGRQEVVFENLDHDFPVRIFYRRVGDTLIAGIEGMEDGQPQRDEWSWQLVRPQ